ncbi:hypothetical protein A8926_7436 [Saccharopolyspora spinosa]|uniref:Uncharacterized protein n=1 Tax=Saccharopolyspora spinosa TaxID=60894 RepID=A0A2N3Y8M8_SACSN|nr:hypothetical protein A8926_7436 [Saccharopolyspora spinosa]
MTTTTTTRAGLRKPTPGRHRIPQATSPVALFTDTTETRSGSGHADTSTDDHGVTHERHQHSKNRTAGGRLITTSSATKCRRIFAVGCHNCATNRALHP